LHIIIPHKKMVHAPRSPRPNSLASIWLCSLIKPLAASAGNSSSSCSIPQQYTMSAALSTFGNGSASSKNDQFSMFHKDGLLFIKAVYENMPVTGDSLAIMDFSKF
jgi:hypothetical protein